MKKAIKFTKNSKNWTKGHSVSTNVTVDFIKHKTISKNSMLND